MTKDKLIWMYWHQGFDQANEVVHQCVASWRHYNPGWELLLLDRSNVGNYIQKLDLAEGKEALLQVQHRSDLIRTKLLLQYGGVWADPTCFCTTPLDAWINGTLTSGLFLFSKPGRDRIIANWFIAAEKDNVLLHKLYNALCNYWSDNDFRNSYKKHARVETFLQRFVNRNPTMARLWLSPLFTKLVRLYPYMIYHYMFYELIKTDADCKRIWEATPKISALNPPVLQRFGLETPMQERWKKIVDDGQIPLFKLKWNVNPAALKDGTVLHYLFNSIR